jgi:hypothetical protein
MMIQTKRGVYKQVWLNNEHTTCKHVEVGEKNYAVELINEELIRVTRDNSTKTVLIRPDYEFVWSLKKTYIRARDAAKGVYEHLERCFGKDGRLWNAADFYTLCDWVIDEMRPAPKRPALGMNYERLLDVAKYAATCKGCFKDVGDGWDVSIDTRYSVKYAYLRNIELHIEHEYMTDKRMTASQFAKVATEHFWNEFFKADGKAA